MLPSPKSGESSLQNWKFIAAQATLIDQLRGKLFTLQAQVDGIINVPQGGKYLHPFKIYQYPRRLRPAADDRDEGDLPEEDWRKFRVRSGRLGTIEEDAIEGTDGAENPDLHDFPDVDDILVPEDTERYYIWIQILPGEVAGIVRHAADPTVAIAPSGDDDGDQWTDFPEADGIHFLVGYVDTNTRSADNIAIVRQLIRTDLLPGVAVPICIDAVPNTFEIPGAIKVQDIPE